MLQQSKDLFATALGATNSIPAFIQSNGPVREARYVRNPDGTPDGGVHDTLYHRRAA